MFQLILVILYFSVQSILGVNNAWPTSCPQSKSYKSLDILSQIGKTKFLVYSSAIACVASIPITIILAYNYNVGAAVIGYAVYMIFQIGFYYFYYTNKVLKFNSRRLFFQSFFPPALIGTGSWVLTAFVFSIIKLDNIYFELLLRSVLFVILFLVFSFKLIIKPKDLKSLIRKQ